MLTFIDTIALNLVKQWLVCDKTASFSSTALICLESEYGQPVRLQTQVLNILHIEPRMQEFTDAIALGICLKTTTCNSILFNHSKALPVIKGFYESPMNGVLEVLSYCKFCIYAHPVNTKFTI